MEEIFQRAYEAAKVNNPAGRWVSLSPAERARAIIEEMRRLDAENRIEAAGLPRTEIAKGGPIESVPVSSRGGSWTRPPGGGR